MTKLIDVNITKFRLFHVYDLNLIKPAGSTKDRCSGSTIKQRSIWTYLKILSLPLI